MDRLIELGQLFDYYGAFLTERQRGLVEAYANDNLSLGEIAEREGISRQGVRDGIVRAEQQLRSMESELGMVRKTLRLQSLLRQLGSLAEQLPQDAPNRELLVKGIKEAYSILEEDDGV